MRKKLTDLATTRIEPPATGRIDVFDLTLPAFGVRVSSTGSRTWMVATRRPGARNPSRISLGKFPQMSTAQARTAAREIMSGETPLPAPVPRERFEEMVERFIEHGRTRRGKSVRPATVRMYRLVLERIAIQLHGKLVREIRRGDIADLLHTVATERGAATAALCRNVMSRFFSWLEEIDAIESNPVRKSPIYAAERGSNVLSDAQLRLLWNGADGQFGSILKLLLLTGARRGEIGGMRWSEIVDGKTWALPASRAKNHVELRLPLPQLAIDVLDQQYRIVGRDAIFGRNGAQGFSDWSGCKKRFDARVHMPRPWTIHDTRRTFRTRMAALGVPREIVARLLNHDLGPIISTYDRHSYSDEKLMALEKWANELLRIVSQPIIGVADIRDRKSA